MEMIDTTDADRDPLAFLSEYDERREREADTMSAGGGMVVAAAIGVAAGVLAVLGGIVGAFAGGVR